MHKVGNTQLTSICYLADVKFGSLLHQKTCQRFKYVHRAQKYIPDSTASVEVCVDKLLSTKFPPQLK